MSGNNADALAVLHQLSSNPQMLSQLQSVLSLLSNGNGDGEDDVPQSGAESFSQDLSSSSVSSPALTLGTRTRQVQPTSTRAGGGGGAGRASGRAQAQAPRAKEGSVSSSRYEQLLQRCTTAEEAADTWAQRFRTSEADVEQLTRDVRLLEEKLDEQRRLYKQLEVKRETDLVNAERIYSAALARQDDVHAEAVRQLMKSHQLQQTAARFEGAVRHKAGLSSAHTPVNVRQTASSGRWVRKDSGSRVKRERSEVEDLSGKFYWSERRRAANSASSYPWKANSERAAAKDDDEPDHITARTKQSTQLIPSHTRHVSDEKRPHSGDSSKTRGAPTTTASATTGRRTTTRRRTPLTPSMTYADRVASRSPVPVSTSRHTMTTVLPTGSWKLDSPTPPHTTASEERRPSPRPVTKAAAMTRYQSQQEATSRSAVAAPTAEEERFVSQYTRAAATKSTTTTAVVPKVASARLPGPTAADSGAPVSPRPLSHSVGALNVSTGALSGTSSAVAGGPTRSPSPLNPKRGPAMARRFILTSLSEEDAVRVQRAIEKLGDNAVVLDAGPDAPPPPETTHVVLYGTPRSVKAMCGVVSSRWLVSPEYVYNSLKVGFWLDELDEGGLRFFPSPVRCQRFLLTMAHDDIRTKLEQVIEYGGGEVVRGGAAATAGGSVAQDVVVISCGDDLLRFATQTQS